MTNYISTPLSTLNADLNTVQSTLSSKADKSELNDYATQTYVQEYVAEHGGGGTPANMSACLSSEEFQSIEVLSNDLTSYALSDVIAKVNEMLSALRRIEPEPFDPNKSRFYFSDSTVVQEDIVGEMDNRYANNATLTKVELGTHVTSIASRAFQECDGITDFTMPSSLTSVGERCLLGWNGAQGQVSITIPESVTNVSEGVFSDNKNISAVTFENEIVTLPNSLFWSASELKYLKFTKPTLAGTYNYTSLNGINGNLSVDFTELTSVPPIDQSKFSGTTKFLVASAYYNDFVNASNFSAASSRIVAV
jgi:hypothetical protein